MGSFPIAFSLFTHILLVKKKGKNSNVSVFWYIFYSDSILCDRKPLAEILYYKKSLCDAQGGKMQTFE